ncbi:MAG: GNAT family N-acetyltransferase [Nostoc sp.]|uniref:GNAT family N-acetyltransferase n=1 Tax=Nostoc sp. TaxID=1180 RepID=UPI002FEEFE17
MENIVTKRLYLVPLKLEIVKAAILGNSELARSLAVTVLPDWPDEEFIQILPGIADILSKYALQSQWGWGSLIIHKAENKLIGHVMIKIIPDATGSPTDSVELGYQVVPSYRRQGYASEAAKAMADWTLYQPGIKKVTAGCNADNIGSKRVLEKIGMRLIETRGKVLIWELCKTEIIG